MGVVIDQPGHYPNLPEAAYHADPVIEPSLSASIAHKLVSQSPRHAFLAHPRLCKQPPEEHSNAAALGTAAHAILLGNEDRRIVVVDAEDYKTKAAQRARDEAVAAKLVPVTPPQLKRAHAMAIAAREQLRMHPDVGDAFDPDRGLSEVTMIWQRGPTWCRARVDRLPGHGRVLLDYKTSTGSAHPDDVQRRLFDTGADVQAAHYLDGDQALGGGAQAMLFVVQEVEVPHLLSVVALNGDAMELGRSKLRRAHMLWAWCRKTGTWPAYPTRTHWIEAPPWEIKREGETPDNLQDLLRAWENFQAPIGWTRGEAA